MWGANDFEIGLLAAIPFLAQFAQLPAALLIDRTGARKKITIALSAFARQSWWLLLPLLFWDVSWRLEFLMVLFIVSGVAIMGATVGWLAWVSDLVPDKIRGRYFGMRSVSVAVATLISTVVGGLVLDYYRGARSGAGRLRNHYRRFMPLCPGRGDPAGPGARQTAGAGSGRYQLVEFSRTVAGRPDSARW